MEDLKIVVVERNIDLVDRINKECSVFGCAVTDTDSGEKGIQLYLQSHPSLIICGNFVDNMKIWKFAHNILRYNPPIKERPYLVATVGVIKQSEKTLCQEMGFDVYKERPFGALDLLEWIFKAKERRGD